MRNPTGLFKAELAKCARAHDDAVKHFKRLYRGVTVLASAAGRGDPSALAVITEALQVFDDATQRFSITGSQEYACWTHSLMNRLPALDD